jgi:hypothetical protein
MADERCKICNKLVLLTDEASRKAFEKRHNVCAPCSGEKRAPSKAVPTQSESYMQWQEQRLKTQYDELLVARKRYFELLHGKKSDLSQGKKRENVLDKIEDNYKVDLLLDVIGDRYTEFFNMGEDGDEPLTFEALIKLIRESKAHGVKIDERTGDPGKGKT